MPDAQDRQAEYLGNRLWKRDRRLRKWARRESVECYRVYDRDTPEIPLAVDRYGPYAHVSLYERPYDKPESEERARLDRMCETVSESLAVLDPGGILYFSTNSRTFRFDETDSGASPSGT